MKYSCCGLEWSHRLWQYSSVIKQCHAGFPKWKFGFIKMNCCFSPFLDCNCPASICLLYTEEWALDYPSCFSCLSLQVITLEGWVEIMYYVMDAHSFYNFIYFILLIIVSIRFDECQQCKLRTDKKQVLDQHRYWGSKLIEISEIWLVDFHQESEGGSHM